MREGQGAGAIPPKMALVGKKNPVLHQKAEAVTPNDYAKLRLVRGRAWATVRDRGYAVALPQLGISKAAVVMRDGTMWLNPKVTPAGDTIEEGTESCLSLPGRTYMVPRHTKVTVTALALGQTEVSTWTTTEPLEARIWQHEMDHLEGRLISDDWPEVPTVL